MAKADFNFYAELNDFLPRKKRDVTITHVFEERASIKDTIESFGVPHPEVDYIEVNGKPVDFSYIVTDSDRIHVYPISAATEKTSSVSLVRPQPLKFPRFVLDIHLGKLATSLRMLGFDTLYRNDYDDLELAQISASEERILLTRDKGLLMRSLVTHGYYVRETNPERQVGEIMGRFALIEFVKPLQRCLRCNGLLEPVDKESILDQVPPNIQQSIDEFSRCRECDRVYWKGTHYEQMQQFIQGIIFSKPVESN
ncbi:Mut7-C RNAse domain-containing protein [Coleofasciculus sp. FACHB-SPT9]|uniref:Mut7-C RNAse domain-containing protein n=1 Tax=Cyanophyceae TaxID=3028117 RepID=UPI001683289C|nr:Mut7-C RNAse domain-containing protein [Coleofasciculus sp. FACHB-SPT9]MBD1889516.1 Mut7-C ubiquitin/RNAse domain-containing protein [Coleofasciculus sp. FACHB-SPT9]